MRRRVPDFDPDLIFVDSANVPIEDQERSERRLEAPLSRVSVALMLFAFGSIGTWFLYSAYVLQVVRGDEFVELSANNRLDYEYVFANRGTITDRNGELLAWNVPPVEEGEFALRRYIAQEGFSHLLGYIKYPKKDKKGFYYNTEYQPIGGIEERFDEDIRGVHGLRVVETNSRGEITSRNGIERPTDGVSLELSIDTVVQTAMYSRIKELANDVGFNGGAGAMIDLETGQIIALTSYPEYSSQVMTDGVDSDAISAALVDERELFLSRATGGLYTPGSIVKPFVALAALQEKVIEPTTRIVSRGFLEVPNPYDPSKPTRFNDWKAHGSVDVTDAIAVSSNVYFYVIGGGFDDMPGLGIARIGDYLGRFGLGQPLKDPLFGSQIGTVPSPAWKAEVFPDEPWRLGDTYYTAIGQYGFQVTMMQMLRAVGAIATSGDLIEPTVLRTEEGERNAVKGIDERWYEEVRAGMRQGAKEGTARALGYTDVLFAAKTGTAELGVSKAKVNSWVMGFYPYEKPKYAFVMLIESGPRSNLVGAPVAARRFFDDLRLLAPEYIFETPEVVEVVDPAAPAATEGGEGAD